MDGIIFTKYAPCVEYLKLNFDKMKTYMKENLDPKTVYDIVMRQEMNYQINLLDAFSWGVNQGCKNIQKVSFSNDEAF